MGKYLRMAQDEKDIQKGILETYGTLISVLKKLPGMSMEDVFRSTPVEELEEEKKFLEDLFKKAN